VDICPVGALTLKEFRFKQRVWFLKDVHSICSGCARGCNVIDGVSKSRILRITPRTNLDVNRWWICDEGRLSYEALYRPGRITAARLTGKHAVRTLAEGEFAAVVPRAAQEPAAGAAEADAMPVVPMLNEGVPPPPRAAGAARGGEVSLSAAIDAAARALDEARTVGGPGAVEFIVSSRVTNEDLFVLGKLAREQFNAASVTLPVHERGEDDDLLIRKDKTPNRAGVRAVMRGLGLAVEGGAPAVARIRSGSVKAILVLGPNLMGVESSPAAAAPGASAGAGGASRADHSGGLGYPGQPSVPGYPSHPSHDDEPPPAAGDSDLFDEIAAAARTAGAVLIAIDAFDSPLTAYAQIVIPALTYGEIEGTFTNFEGRVQRVRAGLAPAADGLPIYRLAQEIARRLGVQPGRAGAQETFSALAAELPAFARLSYAKIGDFGAMLAEPPG
jgi:NADH dehydrogenase/NADH:ubiquinone oxidoreductase subunit G